MQYFSRQNSSISTLKEEVTRRRNPTRDLLYTFRRITVYMLGWWLSGRLTEIVFTEARVCSLFVLNFSDIDFLKSIHFRCIYSVSEAPRSIALASLWRGHFLGSKWWFLFVPKSLVLLRLFGELNSQPSAVSHRAAGVYDYQELIFELKPAKSI